MMAWIRLLAAGMVLAAQMLWAVAGEVRVLQIGAEEYPPFEYSQAGRPTGINADVLEAVFAKLGVDYRISFYPFPRALRMLEEGKLDCCLSMSYHPDREEGFYFSKAQRLFPETFHVPENYLWLTRYVFFANRDTIEKVSIKDFEQLQPANLRIGIVRGYTYDWKLPEAGLNLVPFSTLEDGFLALARREIDLFPADQVVGHSQCRRLGLGELLDHMDFTLVTKPYYLTFSRKSDYPGLDSLNQKFSEGLHALRASGEYARIVARYPAMETADMLRPVVLMGEEWPPFEYKGADGMPEGLDVDVVATIMKRLQRPYDISFYPWSRVLAMVQNGQADAVLSVSYKSTREDLLIYTDEQRRYAETGNVPPDNLWLSQYVFFIKKKNEGRLRFESYEQLAQDGYRVGVNRDYSYSPDFQEAKLQRRIYPTTESALEALIVEEIDLYPIDHTVGLHIIGRMGLRESVTTLEKPLFSKPYLMPFCRRSSLPDVEGLMRDFNAELRAMRASGAYEEIRRRHDAWQPSAR